MRAQSELCILASQETCPSVLRSTFCGAQKAALGPVSGFLSARHPAATVAASPEEALCAFAVVRFSR